VTPANIEVEAALVSRLLLDPSQVPVISSSLTPDDFYSPSYRGAYAAMQRLSRAGKSIDLTTIRSEADNFLLDLPVMEITAIHQAPLADYARIIRDLAIRRRIIEAAQSGDVGRIVEAAELASELTTRTDSLGLVDLQQFRVPPPPPLLGVLAPEGTTVLYGEGGDGKGWIAAKLASQLDTRVAILDFEAHPNEWAYRLDKFGNQDVLYVSPPVTMERWADDRAANLLRSEKIGYLIVDSAMYASNVEDPYSPASAMSYKRSRSRLGNLPALLLAHTAKGQNSVFGSVFWANEARITWHLTRDFLGRRTIECRKANSYGTLEGAKLVIEFDEQRGILNLHEHGRAWTPEPVTEF
jgi:hypothetical protein